MTRLLLPDLRRLLLLLTWDLGGGGWRRWQATQAARGRRAEPESPVPRVERRIRARWRREEMRRARVLRPVAWPVRRGA